MKATKNTQTGFTTSFMIIIAALVVVGIATVGVMVYHSDKTSKSLSSSVTTSSTTKKSTTSTDNQTQQSTTPTLSTYTTSVGGFSFQYPSNWKVTEAQTGGQPGSDDIISIDSLTGVTVENGLATTPNVFSMALFVTSNQDDLAQPRAIPYGAVQQLSNGINLWVSDTAHSAYVESSNTTVSCPTMRIINQDSTHFTYPLANGKYLALDGNFCGGQGSQVTDTYQQQLASSDWSAATALLQSIKFQ
jgi:hypothetical protein